MTPKADGTTLVILKLNSKTAQFKELMKFYEKVRHPIMIVGVQRGIIQFNEVGIFA